jgi:hypothetical protein
MTHPWRQQLNVDRLPVHGVPKPAGGEEFFGPIVLRRSSCSQNFLSIFHPYIYMYHDIVCHGSSSVEFFSTNDPQRIFGRRTRSGKDWNVIRETTPPLNEAIDQGHQSIFVAVPLHSRTPARIGDLTRLALTTTSIRPASQLVGYLPYLRG